MVTPPSSDTSEVSPLPGRRRLSAASLAENQLISTGTYGLGANASPAIDMVAIGAIDLGMSVVGEEEPPREANRCQQHTGGDSDYEPRKDSLVAIAGSIRWFVAIHTESIHPGCRPTPARFRRSCAGGWREGRTPMSRPADRRGVVRGRGLARRDVADEGHRCGPSPAAEVTTTGARPNPGVPPDVSCSASSGRSIASGAISWRMPTTGTTGRVHNRSEGGSTDGSPTTRQPCRAAGSRQALQRDQPRPG